VINTPENYKAGLRRKRIIIITPDNYHINNLKMKIHGISLISHHGNLTRMHSLKHKLQVAEKTIHNLFRMVGIE
jgi:hypothetical protein